MRSLILLCSMVMVASAAPLTPTVDSRTLPAPCRTVAEVPADSASVTPHVDATISSASCMAMNHLHALKLTATPASAQAIDEALAPSLTLLEAVIARGDTGAQIRAQHAKADLYQGAAVMLLATGRDAEPLVGRWRDQARAAYAEAVRLAAQIPDQVASDGVLAFAVSDSEFQLAAR